MRLKYAPIEAKERDMQPADGSSSLETSNTSSKDRTTAVVATVIGSALEVFDFSSYSFFSVIIAKLFFPSSDALTGVLLTALTFGLGFLVRPLGGIILGIYGDRAGRKAAMSLSMLLMTVGIAIVGFAPTYEHFGVGAGIIMVIGRMIQGFGYGGEMGNAATFLSEYAPAHRRGFYSSLIQSSIGAAVLAGAGVGAFVTGALSQEALESWGWRIPFLLGLLIGPVGWFVRQYVGETPTFKRTERSETPLREILSRFPRETFATISLVILWTASTYVLLYYMPTYVVRILKMSASDGFAAGILGGAIIMIVSPIFGSLSDRYGRRVWLIVSSILIAALAYPLFYYINRAPGLTSLLVFQGVFGLLISMYTAPILAVFAEMFPSRVRSTGLSVAYNISVTIFGGFASLIVTTAISWSGSVLAPAAYVVAAALISLLGAVAYPRQQQAF